MKTLVTFFLMSFLISVGLTKDINLDFKYAEYDKAHESQNRIVFKMKSTKLGLITTEFEGVVKEYKISTTLNDSTFSKTSVIFRGDKMDTDISARNSKMHELCLSVDKFPEIKITDVAPIAINKAHQKVSATMNIRGKGHPILLDVSAKVESEKIILNGITNVKLTELEIPDPSILIASVDNNVLIEFHVVANK